MEISGNPMILSAVREAEDRMVTVSLADNGPGMDAETCKRVFKPFFTTKSVGEGTGLGLWVSFFIITQNHDGRISAVPLKGRGTCFQIRLPLGTGGPASPMAGSYH